ncbi:hypothetical protein NUW54_g7465 [Trametes sanguinea]|uniref:Uncharacterized protein n=1 Tax=Trametes sanguinea TaxID=158606 RepID=A0ACC1PLC1_9APHY|nr:hypothetical protein NUW54_g7465 [Trametes sanguinea]
MFIATFSTTVGWAPVGRATRRPRTSPNLYAPPAKSSTPTWWWLILKLGSALICVDACTSLINFDILRARRTGSSPAHRSHPLDTYQCVSALQGGLAAPQLTRPSSGSSGPGDTSEMATWNRSAIEGFVRILVGCLFGMGVFLGHPAPQLRHMSNASLYWPRVLTETVAFHAGVVLACYAVLKLLPSPQAPVSGIREQFRYSHIPLTLFYSSLTKLFLLFCLSIWRPDAAKSPAGPTHGRPQAHPNATTFGHSVIVRALELLDEDKLDREWVVRNVLGGMSAGFGLRVVLDCHPLFTTMIIIAGWTRKNGRGKPRERVGRYRARGGRPSGGRDVVGIQHPMIIARRQYELE